jgi:uncharacterized protein
MLLVFFFLGLSFLVGWRFKAKFNKYAQIPTSSGLSGKEIAEKMLSDYGITDVQVISTSGRLTDHYNPLDKTVNLSEDVYHSRSVAAAAVAAHECGHAVQHATAYSWLKFRSSMVPTLSATNTYIPWILLGGVLLLSIFPYLLGIGIVLLAFTTIFSFVTLPVEYDASRRALAWLDKTDIARGEEYDYAKDGLKWAARTYVIAALSSLATLLYYVGIFNSRD